MKQLVMGSHGYFTLRVHKDRTTTKNMYNAAFSPTDANTLYAIGIYRKCPLRWDMCEGQGIYCMNITTV